VLKYAREKIALLRSDSTRLSRLNADLIAQLHQSRETAAYYQTRWETVENLFIVRQRKNKIKIIPKGRVKTFIFDISKVAAGYLIGQF
jgi:IS4 transposase